jgi:hypothetical protein
MDQNNNSPFLKKDGPVDSQKYVFSNNYVEKSNPSFLSLHRKQYSVNLKISPTKTTDNEKMQRQFKMKRHSMNGVTGNIQDTTKASQQIKINLGILTQRPNVSSLGMNHSKRNLTNRTYCSPANNEAFSFYKK